MVNLVGKKGDSWVVGYPGVANSKSKPKRTKLKRQEVRGKGLQDTKVNVDYDHLIYGATQSAMMRQ